MDALLERSQSETLLEEQHAFNLTRWDEVLAEPYYQQAEGRVETNGFGETIMSPPPAPDHGFNQSEIVYQLRKVMDDGGVFTECPLSTSDGIRGIDVAWMSSERMALRKNEAAFLIAPEICIEVISPSNTRREMEHKKNLYFEAGALEVWFCSRAGEMSFYQKEVPDSPTQSDLVPDMPLKIETY